MNFKKLIALLLVLAMVISAFAGCKKPSKDSGEKDNTEKDNSNSKTDIVEEIPESIMPEISEKEIKAFDEFLEEYASFSSHVDFEKVDVNAEYAISRVIVYGDPDLSGFDVVASIKDPDGYTYVQLSSPEEAAKFDMAQKDKGLESFEDSLVTISSDDNDAFPEYIESEDSYMRELGLSLESSPYSSSTSSASESNSWGTRYIGSAAYANIIHLKKMQNTQIIVALIDDGVDLNHPFYKSRLLPGYDFIDNDNNPTGNKKFGHGTHVAGTIVDNTPGLNVKILPVRVIGFPCVDEHGQPDETGTFSTFINGIKYATNHGASIFNMSLTLKKASIDDAQRKYAEKVLTDAIGKGITICAAAGNKKASTSGYLPAALSKDGLIVVSAIDINENKADFSNHGASVDLCAPGVAIYSCNFDNTFIARNGTSMATPHVSAAAAMVKLSHPDYTPAQIENFLKKYAKDLGEYGKDNDYGVGALQLFECDRKDTIKELYFESEPEKLEYQQGEKINYAGMRIFIRYADEAIKRVTIPKGYEVSSEWKKFLQDCQIVSEPAVFNETGNVNVKVSSIKGGKSFTVLVKGEAPGILPTMNNMFPATSARLLFHPDAPEASEDILFGNRFTDNGISYDEATNTLNLKNVKSGYIFAEAMGNGFTINVSGTNTLSFIATYSVGHSASLKITGSGTLNLLPPSYAEDAYGMIALYADLTDGRLIVDPDVTIRAKNGIRIHATTVEDSIIIKEPNSLVRGIYVVDPDPEMNSAYSKWYVDMQIKNLNGNVPPVYFAYTLPIYGETMISPK